MFPIDRPIPMMKSNFKFGQRLSTDKKTQPNFEILTTGARYSTYKINTTRFHFSQIYKKKNLGSVNYDNFKIWKKQTQINLKMRTSIGKENFFKTLTSNFRYVCTWNLTSPSWEVLLLPIERASHYVPIQGSEENF